MTLFFYFMVFLFLGLCALLSLVILVQESKSLGLGASFGGDSGSSLFGTSTADVLKKFTAYLALIFMLSCLILSLWTGSLGRSHSKAAAPAIEEVQ
ncbi:MAG: preprotein translocase subunit SecG [Simkaniaceae bacterium]|nr:preprotein translocase subunit SecG [Simkaniaceae bacterium]